MLFCASCSVKNCAKKFGKETAFPQSCPSLSPSISEYLKEYDDPTDRLIAQNSTICSPDHSECRIQKTIRFAQMCGYKKIGLAFCATFSKEAQQVDKLFRDAGFEVESIICKVGHLDRTLLEVPGSCNAMCNPIAQAEILNEAGTELNIALCLCVGHDTLFIRHSKAPVTVLAAKDHVYENATLKYLEHLNDNN